MSLPPSIALIADGGSIGIGRGHDQTGTGIEAQGVGLGCGDNGTKLIRRQIENGPAGGRALITVAVDGVAHRDHSLVAHGVINDA